MKTSFVIKSMELNLSLNGETQVIKTPEIHTELEASIGEIKGLYELQKQALAEAPAILEDFAKKFFVAIENTMHNFEAVDNRVRKQQVREHNIDNWFREYFLAPDITEEAKKQFEDFFNAKTIKRIDFFDMDFETKESFFNHVCDTCF